MALMVVYGATGSGLLAADHPFDEPGSFQPALLDASGDSPFGEPGSTDPDASGRFLLPGYSGHSPNLFFIEPPARLLSFPTLPQGPPLFA
ncbi:hypothetical protein [Marinobacter arenosus]|uniref:hypothetical protein n=1 Tax=Marinobacter arenosus TaxID=2856822 RepID=UPI001C4CE269|nr:hypothetical protein [Marinobacter arenosus]MBW0148324.1 hypothetical protein [Marinobacter arenosus]